jgi:hypothetical protein
MPNESKDGNLDTTIAIIPLTRGLYATIDPDGRDYEGKAAAFLGLTEHLFGFKK